MNLFSNNREQGFTILEVVFAVSILAIGIMGFSILKGSSRHSRIYSKNLSQAILFTSSELENLLRIGYNSPMLLVEKDSETIYHYSGKIGGGTPSIGDFTATGNKLRVRGQCPTELTKLVDCTTLWSNKSITLGQVQVRP